MANTCHTISLCQHHTCLPAILCAPFKVGACTDGSKPRGVFGNCATCINLSNHVSNHLTILVISTTWAPKRFSSAGFPSLSGEAVPGPSWAHPSSHVCIKDHQGNTFCHRRIKPRIHLLQHLLLVWVCVSVCEFVLIYIDFRGCSLQIEKWPLSSCTSFCQPPSVTRQLAYLDHLLPQ